jgi:hypothetical protein
MGAFAYHGQDSGEREYGCGSLHEGGRHIAGALMEWSLVVSGGISIVCGRVKRGSCTCGGDYLGRMAVLIRWWHLSCITSRRRRENASERIFLVVDHVFSPPLAAVMCPCEMTGYLALRLGPSTTRESRVLLAMQVPCAASHWGMPFVLARTTPSASEGDEKTRRRETWLAL